MQYSRACAPVVRALSKCMAQILGIYSAIQCMSTDQLDKRSELSKSSSLPAMRCGCVTVQELFESGVIFFSSSECSHAGLIQEWEEIKAVRLLTGCVL